MGLNEYKKKRNFSKTSEPKAIKNKPAPAGTKRFVVQKHSASTLHYDFRIEIKDPAEGSLLASWAVPKNIPAKPNVKHLAIRTEDHPLEYLDFSGTIPAGEYGAGKVEIWDKGDWRLVNGSLEEGRLEIELSGKKLSGQYMLIRTKGFSKKAPPQGVGSNWLVFKKKSSQRQD